MTILERLKELIEIDVAEEIFDVQLLQYVNMGLRYLANNAIPVGVATELTAFEDFDKLREGDWNIVLAWLHLYVIDRFDSISANSNSRGSTAWQTWLSEDMADKLYQLKTFYDRGSAA